MSLPALPKPPSPLQLRDELETMVLKELLGPGSAEEEIVESPGTRYFVGVLAPRKRTHAESAPAQPHTTPTAPAGDEEAEADGEILDGDDLALGGRDTSQDGTTDQAAAQEQAQALIPSSFGVTFSVNPEASEIDLCAAWGQYLREKSEYLVSEKTGNPRLVWKRYPRGGRHRLKLAAGHIQPITVDHNCPEVVVQGLVRKRSDHWCVTLFLVNEQQEPEKRKDTAWVFQPELVAEGVDGAAVLHKRHTVLELTGTDPAVKAENELLAMLYRRHVEFAVGHGVGVHVDVSTDPNHAVRVRTKVVPSYEVPKNTPPTTADASINPAFAKLDGLVLDMKVLAETSPKQYRPKLKPLVDAYRDWIDREELRTADPAEGLSHFKHAAQQSITRCHTTLQRIEAGLDLLDKDDKAAQAFQFMNRAMWLQRTHSQFAERVRRGDEQPDMGAIDVPENRSWYPFQLAFVLLNLPGITRFDHPERSEAADAVADLLWFPTGGGKTEAYLGLTAYTLGLRRLQGVVEGRSGENGVTVLMRYTLRLLTLQQFQRAAALICACEDIRRTALSNSDTRWGKTPFRIGLWVGGSTTPNWTSDADEAVKSAHGGKPKSGAASPHQLTNCPWCGTKIDPGKHIKVEKYGEGACRTLIFCGAKFGQCKFSMKEAPGEGLPVMVVDEEIYRRLPSLLITTVDKFAQMPWNGSVQMLFGQVDGCCERHGFRSPGLAEASEELEVGGVHRAKGSAPQARVLPHNPLRPPDLIIQDELHLISGPLGTLVGLYETAVDRLSTWEVGGKKVRPKVVASTATIRRASDQVYGLFLRSLNVFPPNGLEIGDNFFSLQRKSAEKTTGRKYIGICAPGRRLKAALIRVYVAFLSAGQVLFEKDGLDADPWMTLVGYFNSLRELGGMKRLVDDDVRTRLGKMQDRGLAKRRLYTPDTVKELTSRLGSTAIPETLDHLEGRFDPAVLGEIKDRKKKDEFIRRPLDVLLATNMISVGVDVPRLGLMVVGGQPKTTAEYIQASSRVGRKFPGLVCTVFNWARPRDLSHYETFEHYRSTFYKHVEALSVTPFSSGATARGLAALLVSLVRQPGSEFNSNDKAMLMATQRGHHYVTDAIEAITRRAELIAGPEAAEEVRQQLKRKMDLWQKRAQRTAQGNQLGYETKKDGVTVGLLRKPSIEPWDEFTCLNSLRDVEPTANLILDTFGMDDEGDEVEEGAAT
ncbi:DISARM system helicase DrmA [Gemmata sp. JC717]|uniref:DISARM system helicase DrmA n=1 Tax=Gemmata algarum TaxID=2975278 RepID=UPI0021BB901C|nr:DISARM system helicase DrmA [Gemmata algarum]MDY3556175.1 DISARM system helicase DrmA [Gemmata algarum]